MGLTIHLRRGLAAILAACALLSSIHAFAQTIPEESAKYLTVDRTLSPLGADVFGEQVDLYTGGLSFSHTDVDLPGNSALPVQVVRTLVVGQASSARAFAHWELDLPHLHGVYAQSTGWAAMPPTPAARCSSSAGLAPPPVPALQGVDVFMADEYWAGVSLSLPGGGSQRVMRRNPGNPHVPSNAHPLVTRDGWAIQCLPGIANGTGEGFLARAPDGTRYTFDWLTYRPTTSLSKPIWTNNKAGDESPDEITTAVLQRVDARMLPTRVEDRFGNWVEYTYDPQQPRHLTSITASDGRSLSIAYIGDHISKVTHGAREWNYIYTADSLTGLTLPDGAQWSFDTTALLQARPQLTPGPSSCDALNPLNNANATWTGSITHPSGAVGSFTVGVQRHGLSNVPKFCVDMAGSNYADIPNMFDAIALRSKTVSGPGLTPATWTTSFGPANASWAPCNGNCPTSKTVDVVDPAGHRTRHTFDNRKAHHGRLLETAIGVVGNTALQRQTQVYAQASGNAWPAVLGELDVFRGDLEHTTTLTPVTTRTITQGGNTFTWTATSFDTHARPLSITRSSSLGDSRTELTTYHDNPTHWVLGQVATRTLDGVLAAHTSYTSRAQPHIVSREGEVRSTSTYHPDGTLATVTDARGHVTRLDSWHRGLPRTVTHPDNHTQLATVNDAGWITAVTDETGATTSYGHDALGRISSIVYPAGNLPAWNTTTQVFEKMLQPDPAMPAGHWRQTISTGNARNITYFDALWRPILTHQADTNNAATASYQRLAWDHDGRATFASYPGDTPSLTTGTWTSYDALGRQTTVAQDSELGLLSTVTEYLPGLQTRTTNPRGHATVTAWQAFDTPAYDAPRSITGPEGVTTTFTRDTRGKPLSMTRSGLWQGASLSTTRTYVYDTQQRLCKLIEPETGASVFAYDPAGNTAWIATGQVLTDASCDRASVPAAQRAVHTHDSRNRLTRIDYPAGAADLDYTYHPDGALHTATASAVGPSPASTWTYTYNTRRLLTHEQLNFDGSSQTITHSYDANASRTSLAYPSGLSLGYAPNALGQPTQAGSYASAVSYHRNGAVAAFTYGNGATRSITQTDRQWPDRIRDQRNGATLFDHDLNYDKNGNVEKIVDGLPGGIESRTLAYDPRDRLIAVTDAPTGSEAYAYDALDHLRQAKLLGLDRRYAYNADNQLDEIATVTDELLMRYTWNSRGALLARSRPGQASAQDVFRDGFELGGDVPALNTQAFAFDTANRLRSIAGLATYTYDAHGHRLRTDRQNGTRRTALYSRNGQLLEETDTQTNQRIDFIALNGTLVAKRTRAINGNTATATYLHSNHLGTPAVESSATGQTTLRTRLSPYGIPYDNQWRNGPGFTGHSADADSELVYMQQRYYDSNGAFLSPDPISANSASFDRYWYSNNNPYRYVDPDGRWSCDASAANCANFEAALGRGDRASRSDVLSSSEKALLRAAVAQYGVKGDASVQIAFKDDTDIIKGSAGFTADGGRKITLDSKRSGDDLAIDVMHEGSHGADDVARGGPLATRKERMNSEVKAYTTQAYFQKAENISRKLSDGWTEVGGINPENIEKQAEESVRRACKNETQGSCG